ncbi:MAG: hypothetical protein U0798_19930 [Gemmataceae bacterium]
MLMVVALASLIVGCQKSSVARSNVSGKVSYKGQPLTIGSVQFFPEDGNKPQIATIGRDGVYRLSEAISGKYQLAIITPEKPADGKKAIKRPSAPDPVYIPAKYSKPSTSNLSYEVTKQSTTFDIELTD